MDEGDIYDEFGNLIGDAFDSDAESSEEERVEVSQLPSHSASDSKDDEDEEMNEASELEGGALAKHSLSGTFGPNVETIISRPTDEIVDEPVIQPIRSKSMKIEEDATGSVDENLEFEPSCIYSRKYMVELAEKLPERIRNIALVGGLHSGKSTFVDMLVLHTHANSISLPKELKSFKPLRYMDNHKLEIDRGMTVKTNAITLLLSDSQERSYVCNILDTPGHPNFIDEAKSAMQAVDGIVYVVDIVEGLKNSTDKLVLTHAIKQNLPITIVLNKIDRLILELRLPVHDSYYKIRNILEDINKFIKESEYIGSYKHETDMSPLNGNVIFASATYQFTFSLQTFANLYRESFGNDINLFDFSEKLWGDVFYDEDNNQFIGFSENGKHKRSFNSFILEPLYKVFIQSVTSDSTGKKLSQTLWNNFKLKLHKSTAKQDIQVLLKDVLSAVFATSGGGGVLSGFVDMIGSGVLNPMEKSDQLSLVGHVVKLIENSSGDMFHSLVRIVSGTLRVGDQVRVLGENYEEDEEDQRLETVTELFLAGGRYKTPVKSVGPGSIVLIGGIDRIISKGATIVLDLQLLDSIENLYIPPSYTASSVFKVAIEPAKPSQLPLLLEGFLKLNKSYLSCQIKVEESGEHVVLAPGELYMDCMLHDLRFFFTDNLEIKVSDPMTKFSETCINPSTTKITTRSTNGQNLISIIAEPVNDGNLSRAIELGENLTPKRLRNEFGWDSLASRSIWCFNSAPDNLMPNILLDDTLPGETNKELLASVKESINLGFKWSSNEGPLCDEPIRGTKFKILDAVLSEVSIQRNGTQVIPMTRKACYTGIMTATPRLMEPIYSVHATCSSYGAAKAISRLLSKRRGYVLEGSDYPIPATKLFQVEGVVPVIESIGLETDVRIQTQGQAMVFLEFSKWDIVPGNPLDKDCFQPALRPVPTESLARDFVMKTRKRKGLSGEPNLLKYIDNELFEKLKESGLI